MTFNIKYKKSIERDLGRLDKKGARRILEKTKSLFLNALNHIRFLKVKLPD